MTGEPARQEHEIALGVETPSPARVWKPHASMVVPAGKKSPLFGGRYTQSTEGKAVRNVNLAPAKDARWSRPGRCRLGMLAVARMWQSAAPRSTLQDLKAAGRSSRARGCDACRRKAAMHYLPCCFLSSRVCVCFLRVSGKGGRRWGYSPGRVRSPTLLGIKQLAGEPGSFAGQGGCLGKGTHRASHVSDLGSVARPDGANHNLRSPIRKISRGRR